MIHGKIDSKIERWVDRWIDKIERKIGKFRWIDRHKDSQRFT